MHHFSSTAAAFSLIALIATATFAPLGQAQQMPICHQKVDSQHISLQLGRCSADERGVLRGGPFVQVLLTRSDGAVTIMSLDTLNEGKPTTAEQITINTSGMWRLVHSPKGSTPAAKLEPRDVPEWLLDFLTQNHEAIEASAGDPKAVSQVRRFVQDSAGIAQQVQEKKSRERAAEVVTNTLVEPDIPATVLRLRSPQGCTLQLISQFIEKAPPARVRLLSVGPGVACRNGQAQGVWIFGTEFPEAPHPSVERVGVFAAAFDAGTTKWMNIRFTRTRALIYQLDEYGKWWVSQKANRIQKGDSSATLQSAFDEVAALTKVPPTERAALFAAAQRWLSDPEAFVDLYTADTGMPFVQAEKILLVDPVREAAARQRREAEAMRLAEEQRQAAAAAREQREFRASLAKMNPGQLFNRADELQAAGDSARANEVRRNLIERFPNHALAAVAAQKTVASAQGSTPAPALASQTAGGAGMSCRDAVSRLQQALNGAGNERKFLDSAVGNQVQEQILWVTNFYNKSVNQLPQCASDAAYRKRFDDDLAATRKNCPSRTRGPANCTAGANHYLDERQIQAVLQQLMGPGGSGAQPTKSPMDSACASRIAAINRRFEEAQRTIAPNSVVVLSEATMWMLSESINAISAHCPQSEIYSKNAKQYGETLAQTKRVCDATSSRGPCVARLPEAEVARAVVQPPRTEPAPGQSAQPASCEGQTGTNWLSCQRQACAKVSGVLEMKGSCISCNWNGGGFNRCPPGSGVNSDR